MILSYAQRSHRTRRKLSQTAGPLRCAAFDISRWPSSCFANISSHCAIAAVWSSVSKPSPHHVVAEHSTIKVERRSEEHTSELQSLMRISYAVFCLKKKKHNEQQQNK